MSQPRSFDYGASPNVRPNSSCLSEGSKNKIDNLKRTSIESHAHCKEIGDTIELTLEKRFTFWSLLGYQLSIMASWSNYLVIAGTFVYVGGPAAMIYGALLVGFFQLITALSLSELASVWPHAGGSQFWVTQLMSPTSSGLFSYLTGWMNILGYLTAGASANFAAAQTITALVTLLNQYQWPRYQVFLVYCALCLLDIPINVYPKYYSAFNIASLIWLMVSLIITIAVWASDFQHQSAQYVFTTFINNSGWKHDGMAFLISLTQTTYAATGLDAVVHLSEETHDSKRTIPLVLTTSVAASTFMSFGFAIFLLFKMGDFSNLVDLSLGQVYLQLYADSIGFRAGLAVATTIMTLLAIFVASQILTGSSRLIWAMARQQGVPFSDYFSYVNPDFKVPLRSFVASFVVTVLLGLLYLAGDLAWNAIASSVTIAYQLVFTAPVLVLLCRGRAKLPKRYFDVGRVQFVGYTINILTVVWGIFISVISIFPITLPVTGDTMNYAVVVFIIWGIIVGTYWLTVGRQKFTSTVVL
ncbi:Choline transport protein [Fusarium oxysporum f. sp. rapae]|uniref:Choline transport protein n=1 Tax=Fusarium oxysporum f. sp. rapae TaxID=485398 RepID=A0A8J5NIF9_FUSOX|nr:Choline transport protein [Fusarium oxysporum f. sp. rapae]